MRALLVLALGGGAALVAGIASASGEGAAPMPSYAELPVGRISTVVTTKPPRVIGRRESVAGVFVAPPQRFEGVRAEFLPVSVSASPKPSHGETLALTAPYAPCFAPFQASMKPMLDDPDASPSLREWGATAPFTAETQLMRRQSDDEGSGTSAVHVERFVEKDGVFSLDLSDTWVDPDHRGVRLIDHAVLPLRLIGRSRLGIRVFAARDERPDGKKLVEYVVVRDPDPDDEDRFVQIMRPDGEFTQSTCGHARLGLPVEPEGASGIFEMQVTTTTPTKEEAAIGDATRRVRPLQVQVSVSKTSRDREPVLSVSFAWSGREGAR